MARLRLYITLTRPLFLLGGFLAYALGVGIAVFLGKDIDWGTYWLGQFYVTMLQLSTHYLNEYFDTDGDLLNRNRTPFTGGSGAIGPGKLERRQALYLAMGCLAILASLTVLVIAWINPAALVYWIMLISFLGAFFYSVPPVRLQASGYGELTTTVLVAILLPSFAYALQTGELHRLIPLTTMPLAAIHLAMLIAFDFPDFAADSKSQKMTLVVRAGWANAMLIHNLTVLAAYFLLVLAFSFGLPRSVSLAALITIPAGLLQIWQMQRIAAGYKPSWTGLTLNALLSFSLMVYMMAFAYWIS